MHDELQARNRRATVLLVSGSFGLLWLVAAAAAVYLGFDLSEPFGMVSVVLVATGVAGLSSVTAWYSSDRVALAVSRAHPIDPTGDPQHQQFRNVAEGVAVAAGLPLPRLYVVDDPAPNAFATGRNADNAAVAVTSGLLEKLSRSELEAVVAHEFAHIRNNDLLVATLAVTFAGAIVIIAEVLGRFAYFGGGRRRGKESNAVLVVVALVVVLLAPLAAHAIRFAVSRQREYLADATAVELTRNPAAVVSALEKLWADTTVVRNATRATAHLWIEEPNDVTSRSASGRASRAFASHPPLELRIERIRELYGAVPPAL